MIIQKTLLEKQEKQKIKIQTAFRKPTHPYILVLKRSNLNKYPKKLKNSFGNTQFFIDPNNPSKNMFLTANGSFTTKNLTGAKKLSSF